MCEELISEITYSQASESLFPIYLAINSCENQLVVGRSWCPRLTYLKILVLLDRARHSVTQLPFWQGDLLPSWP